MTSPFMIFGGAPRVTVPSPLENRDAFLKHLGIGERELRKIWWFRSRMYHEFDISKKSGKQRLISAPDDRLKFIQRKIASLLAEMYRPRNSVHGFVADRSVVTNANAHHRSKFVINLDIEGFFPSISENRVSGLLKALGVDRDVADIIARLCSNKAVLPQGAPTSPVLSNMICFKLDKELFAIAKSTHCIYTRYADDITFSSYQPPGNLFPLGIPASGCFDPSILHPLFVSSFTNNGFKLNAAKAHYGDRYSRRIVTGIKVNQGLNVDRKFVRNIRSALFSIETLGLTGAQEKFEKQYGGSCHLAQFIMGKISWIKSVKGQSDPVFRGLAARYNKAFPTRPIKIEPTPAEILNRAVWVLEHFEGDWAQGSAFFLKDGGLVTAWHCVEEALGKEITVYHPSKPSNQFQVTVEKHHVLRDLALLKHTIPTHEYFELNCSAREYSVGERLTAAGYPAFAPGDGLNLRPGQISSFSVKHSVPLIEVTQKLTQGMSGGPVLDLDGNVAGVIHKGGPQEGRDFAVHARALKNWLAE